MLVEIYLPCLLEATTRLSGGVKINNSDNINDELLLSEWIKLLSVCGDQQLCYSTVRVYLLDSFDWRSALTSTTQS